MKFLTAACVVLCLSISATSYIISVQRICQSHIFGTYREELGEALQNNISEDDEDLGYYLWCLYKGYGVISEDETFNERNLPKYIAANLKGVDPNEVNSATVESSLRNCKDVVVADMKRTAIRLNNCVLKIVTPK